MRHRVLYEVVHLVIAACLLSTCRALRPSASPHESHSTTNSWCQRLTDERLHSFLDSRRQFFSKSMTAPLLPLSTVLFSQQVLALTPDQAESDYDTYASDYDALDGGSAASLLGIEQARTQLLKKARGKVLEIGVGTGLNLAYYDAASVTSLTLVDVSGNMLQAAERRAKSFNNLQNIPTKFIKADATSELVDRFGAASFDTVIDTFSLCVMGNAGARQCLRQLQQVTKPDTGRVLLLENSRSDNPLLGTYQDATADAAAMAGKGCVYNQNVNAMLRDADLEILETQSFAAGLFRSYECRRQQ